MSVPFSAQMVSSETCVAITAKYHNNIRQLTNIPRDFFRPICPRAIGARGQKPNVRAHCLHKFSATRLICPLFRRTPRENREDCYKTLPCKDHRASLIRHPDNEQIAKLNDPPPNCHVHHLCCHAHRRRFRQCRQRNERHRCSTGHSGRPSGLNKGSRGPIGMTHPARRCAIRQERRAAPYPHRFLRYHQGLAAHRGGTMW